MLPFVTDTIKVSYLKTMPEMHCQKEKKNDTPFKDKDNDTPFKDLGRCSGLMHG